jgi:hypothetical protein
VMGPASLALNSQKNWLPWLEFFKHSAPFAAPAGLELSS